METEKKINLLTTLKFLIKVGINFLIFSLPLFFLTITNDYFQFNKLILLVMGTGVLLVLWAVKILVEKKFTIKKSPFDIFLFLFVLVFVLATIFSQNKLISFIGYSGNLHWNLVEVITFYFLYYLISANLDEGKDTVIASLTFVASTIIASFTTLLSYFSVIKPTFMGGLPLDPTASPSTLSILIVISLVILTNLFLLQQKQTKENKNEGKTFIVGLIYGITALVLMGTFLLTSPLTTSTLSKVTKIDYVKEISLPTQVSWSVALDTFKNVPLLGSGPNTFLFDYNQFRPQGLNYTNIWNIKFTKPQNEYFLLLSEVGGIGLLTFLALLGVIVLTLLKSLKKGNQSEQANFFLLSLIALFIIFAFVPSTLITIFAFVLLLALSTINLKNKNISEEVTIGFVSQKKESNTVSTTLSWVMLGLSLLFLILTTYYSTKFFKAEVYYKKALLAYSNNDGVNSYEYLQKTVNENPYRDQYRNSYAQTSLLLATLLSQKEEAELTDTDKNNIQQLLQQSVREIKTVTEVLVPQSPDNWALRGEVYRQLLSVSKESAASFAIEAYSNAISLDPSNPLLRVDFGGIYYQLEQYPQAITQFQNAALLKNDYANAYYNLASSYKANGQNDLSQQAYEQVLKLIEDKESEDYKKVVI